MVIQAGGEVGFAKKWRPEGPIPSTKSQAFGLGWWNRPFGPGFGCANANPRHGAWYTQISGPFFPACRGTPRYNRPVSASNVPVRASFTVVIFSSIW